MPTSLINAMCAVNYYRSLAIGGVRPTHVPVRVNLPATVRGIGRTVSPGEYDCDCDQYGLPLLILGAGRMKIKLKDFEVLEWGKNPYLLKGGDA